MTPQQQRTLDFVRTFYAENGRGPTVRQVRDGVGLSSTSGVHRQLRALVDYGFLAQTAEFSGNLVPVDKDAIELARIPTAALLAELDRRESERLASEHAS